jgi:dimethylhistidine N-methyltransferase
VDISASALREAAARLREEFPALPVHPVHADFHAGIEIPAGADGDGRRVVYFPGSTIGNFEPDEAVALLRRLRRLAGDDGGLLLGVDLRKPAEVLLPAYDDAAGVTAAFNLNLLVRLREELGAAVDVDAFSHRAVWNAAEGRVEMHLVSDVDQEVVLDGTAIPFAAGETIHTENSYKFEPRDVDVLLRGAGFAPRESWTDPRSWFAVLYASCAPS